MNNNNYVNWSNRWIFILAATGSAVGLGNIWKFPYITGENGGGAFVLVYLACIFALGIPVMMAEAMLGKTGRANPVHAMLHVCQQSKVSKHWCIIGIMGIITAIMILCFYSVIAGWAVQYIAYSAQSSFTGQSAETIGQQFTQLLGNETQLLIAHTIFISTTGIVIGLGVSGGLEKAIRILMPTLFVLLLVLIGFSLIKGDAASAIHFMFDVDFSKLSASNILIALGHAFFTLSLAMGAIMVYGSYMPEKTPIGKTVLTVALLDTAIALGAGLAIFPLVFANALEPSEGPGLLFVTLPIAFGSMPGGVFFGTTFFILVSIAALSSEMSLLEPGVAWMQRRGISRVLSTTILTLIAWAGGVACIYSNNWLEDKPSDGYYFFETIDHIASNIMLPLGGILIAVFVGWVMKSSETQKAIQIRSPLIYNAWIWALRIIAPVSITLIFISNLGLL